MKWLRFLYRLGRLSRTPVFRAAEVSVRRVQANRLLNDAAEEEHTLAYCPRCGQLPDGDRRQEEAREIALEMLDKVPARSDLDFAMALHYWMLRKG